MLYYDFSGFFYLILVTTTGICTLMISILQRRELREVGELVQSHTASEWQWQDLRF